MNTNDQIPSNNLGDFGQPSLAEIAEKLAADSQTANPDTNQENSQPVRPEVVFIDENEAAAATKAQQMPIIEYTMQTASGERQPLPLVIDKREDSGAETESRFAVDPFAHEVDGQIPAMPSLPVVDAQQLTERVIERQSSGDHYAWTLLNTPYPDEGNVEAGNPMMQPTADVDPQTQHSDPPMPTAAQPLVQEVVCDGQQDCFIAHPGQVITIDGNKGFDHIDLRSYSIDDATFQPGTILLHTDVDPTEVAEGEQLPPPITIRHRSVRFAIFKDEVRVDL